MFRVIRIACNVFAGFLIGIGLVLKVVYAAPLTNGGFEVGNLTGWSAGGGTGGVPSFPADCSPTGLGQNRDAVVNGLPLLAPIEGSYMAMLTTVGGLPPGANTGGCSQLNFFPILVPVPFSFTQSAIWQTFSVSKPEAIEFAWNFLTNDTNGFDSGIVSVFESSSVPLCPPSAPTTACPPGQVLANAGDATIGVPFSSQPPVVSGVYYRQTGWRTSSVDLPGAGDYTVIFGVGETEDSLLASALLVDNVRVVPEPKTLVLLGLALAGLGFARRRKLH